MAGGELRDDDDEPPPLESDTESDDEGDEPERVPFGSNREFVVLFAGIPGWDALPEQAVSRHNITAYPYDTEREGRSHDLACDVVCATAFQQVTAPASTPCRPRRSNAGPQGRRGAAGAAAQVCGGVRRCAAVCVGVRRCAGVVRAVAVVAAVAVSPPAAVAVAAAVATVATRVRAMAVPTVAAAAAALLGQPSLPPRSSGR